MSEIEGIETLAGTVADIRIEGPQNGAADLPPDVAQAVRDARRDVPAAEPLSAEEIAERTARAQEAAAAANPLFGQLLKDDGDEIVVTSEILPPGTTVAQAIQDAAEAEGLFDGSAYVAVPEIDGQTADKLVIAFSGSIAYDAADEDGQALFHRLSLGHAVELRVAGVVAAKTGTYKVTARDEEIVTGKATLKVDTVYVLSPEAL